MDNVSKTNSNVNIFRSVRVNKLEFINDCGFDVFFSKYVVTHGMSKIKSCYGYLENGDITDDTVSVAGRIIAYRNNGMFIDISESDGSLQLFFHKKFLGEVSLILLKKLDIGDFIGAKGIIRRSKRGEITLDVKNFNILTKSLLPLPEKYHGLIDKEVRYRKRYLDIITNKKSRDILRRRFLIISLVRCFFNNKDFLEVETPMLHSLPGGASAKPFVTHHNALSADLYLRIAPELYLKRLIIGGISEKIFEMNRCFRNEGISLRHNPEFTMVEIYQAYSDYYDMMDLFEDLIHSLSNKLLSNNDVCTPNKELDISIPWFSVTLLDLIYKFLGLDFISKRTVLEATEIARSINIEVPEGYSWGKIVFLIFEKKIEGHLIQPIHILDMPYDISPLARVKFSDSRLTERFESFINGWEIANSFSEISDPIDQRRRFQEQQDLKNILTDDASLHIDEDFLVAMEHGMPPTGGLGIGIDRLVMLLTNSTNIKDVIAFPTMRTRS